MKYRLNDMCVQSFLIKRVRDKSIGFEPMIWESTGGLLKESEDVLLSLRRAADERLGLRSGISKDKFCGRISLNLQRGFHQARAQQRAHMAHIAAHAAGGGYRG